MKADDCFSWAVTMIKKPVAVLGMEIDMRFVRVAIGACMVLASIVAAPMTGAAVVTYEPVTGGVNKVLVGESHVCYVGVDGISCAGKNDHGQLGDGTGDARSYMEPISSPEPSDPSYMNFRNLFYAAAGSNHTCFVTSSSAPDASALYCFGDNAYGQLGDGTTDDRNVPTRVVDNGAFVNENISEVYAGYNQTCAKKGDDLFCWGDNDHGQLGDGTTDSRSKPTPVGGDIGTSGILNAVVIGAGHTCAVLGTSTGYNTYPVMCWGDNSSGQLGDGTQVDRLVPTYAGVAGTQSTDGLAAGDDFTCTYGNTDQDFTDAAPGSPDERVYCWGANDKGQLGLGSSAGNGPFTSPQALPAAGDFAPIKGDNGADDYADSYVGILTAGGQTACAQISTQDGSTAYYEKTVFCWGGNTAGQASPSQSGVEIRVPTALPDNADEDFDNGASSVDFARDIRTLVVSPSETTGAACTGRWCWGNNAFGQLGQGHQDSVTGVVQLKTREVSPDDLSGATVQAVLGADGVVVTVTGVLDDSLENVYLSVQPAPSGSENSDNDSDSSVYYMGISLRGSTLPLIVDGVLTYTIPNIVLEECGEEDCVTTEIEFTADGSYALLYSLVGDDSNSEYPDGWILTNNDDSDLLAVVIGDDAPSADDSDESASPDDTASDSDESASDESASDESASDSDDSTSDDTASDSDESSSSSVPGGVVAPGDGVVSERVTESNASTFVRSPGEVSLVDGDGNPVIGELVRVSDEVGSVPAASRTPEQVAQIRSEAVALVEALSSRAPEGSDVPVQVVETETGANLSGLVTDPADGTSDLPVPVEDVVLLVTDEQALLLGGADGPADPADLRGGVLELGPDGEVSAVAYGLTPGASGELVVMSSPTLMGTFTVGADGSFQGQAALPSTLAAGSHTVVLAVDGLVASAGVVVTGEVMLPVTGSGSSSVPWAVLVVAAGALAVLVIRRRVVV